MFGISISSKVELTKNTRISHMGFLYMATILNPTWLPRACVYLEIHLYFENVFLFKIFLRCFFYFGLVEMKNKI